MKLCMRRLPLGRLSDRNGFIFWLSCAYTEKCLFLCTIKPGLNLLTELKLESTTRKDPVSLIDRVYSLILTHEKAPVGSGGGGGDRGASWPVSGDTRVIFQAQKAERSLAKQGPRCISRGWGTLVPPAQGVHRNSAQKATSSGHNTEPRTQHKSLEHGF